MSSKYTHHRTGAPLSEQFGSALVAFAIRNINHGPRPSSVATVLRQAQDSYSRFRALGRVASDRAMRARFRQQAQAGL